MKSPTFFLKPEIGRIGICYVRFYITTEIQLNYKFFLYHKLKTISRAFQRPYNFRCFLTPCAGYAAKRQSFSFGFLLCCLISTNCVCSYTTSKRMELESPATSIIKKDFKGFPTVIYLLIFQYCQGKLQIKTFSEFFHQVFRELQLSLSHIKM